MVLSRARVVVSLSFGVFACSGAPSPEASVGDSHDRAEGDERSGPSRAQLARERDIEQVLQLVLDAPELAGYWHVEERPERAPLEMEISADPITFAQSHGRPGPKLVKFGQPVIVRNTPPAEGDKPWELRFTANVRVAGDSASVEFQYRVEGIGGAAELMKEGEAWRIAKIHVAERSGRPADVEP